MKPIVIIPARKGSKGVAGKNEKMLNGKPLIQYTIEAATQVFSAAQICITTDSDSIIQIAEELGLKVPFKRPDLLATDMASSYDVIKHAVLYCNQNLDLSSDTIILLQPTSPFRNAEQIREAMDMYDSSAMDMLVSVNETAQNPYYTLFEENKYGFLEKSKNGDFSRRQDCPKVWEVNGAIYVYNQYKYINEGLQSLKRIMKYEMDAISSHDIDKELDWMVAEQIAQSYS